MSIFLNMTDMKKKVDDFKKQFKEEAEKLIDDVFPNKILELGALYNEMQITKLSDIHCDLNIPVPDPTTYLNGPDEPFGKKRKLGQVEYGQMETVTGTRVLVLPNGSAPLNHHIMDHCERMKPLIRELIDHANVIKMWITLLIPKIEDGNNFGVSIQEDTLAEARQVETEAATYLEQISRYFLNRAKIITKVAKYPHVEDYRQAVKELDEKQFICLRLTCCELRNHYASLHDIIHKNMDKIKKPRNANAENLY